MIAAFHRRFRKRYEKLPRQTQKAFEERLELFLINPHARELENHKLNPPWEGCWSINVTGDIRAIYEPQQKNRVLFLRIGSHAELYGK